MNGFFIWNCLMLLICLLNWYSITRDHAPVYLKMLMFFFVLIVGLITALSYGTGPFSGKDN
jgi:hypothetical protein